MKTIDIYNDLMDCAEVQEFGTLKNLLEEAADRLEELDERVAIMSAEPDVGGWISVKEAIPPIITQKEEDFRSELIDVYCCGNCGQELEQYPRKWNYCPICGKAVKWDEQG